MIVDVSDLRREITYPVDQNLYARYSHPLNKKESIFTHSPLYILYIDNINARGTSGYYPGNSEVKIR